MSKSKPSKQELLDQLDVFGIVDDTKLTVLDRSTLEAWTNCPYAAKHGELHPPVMPTVAEVGTQIHACYSAALLAWIETDGQLMPGDLRIELESALRASRPDLQPQVIDAAWYTVYPWSQLVWGIHPGNVLRFDGGDEVDRSGQISWTIDDLGVTVTSEIDLLYAGASIELLHEVDYKTGHKQYTAQSVRESFQFQLHAWLVFNNYPEVNGLEVVVWNTRRNERTFKVVFLRKDLGELSARVRMAVQTRIQQYDAPETWPTLEKCSNCDVATICPVGFLPMRDLESDPAKFICDMAAVAARLDAMEDLAKGYVTRTGKDIVADGVSFGTGKEKKERQPKAVLY